MIKLLVARSHELERWDVKHAAEPAWHRDPSEIKPFGHVAVRRVERSDGTLRLGSVHFDGRISVRPPETTVKGQTFVAHGSDLVFSKIDARNGAFGVVPDEVAPLAFTAEYPIYDLGQIGELMPDFAKLLCRTRTFRAIVQARVVGHSGRKRVAPELFEEIPVVVPPFAEQKSIVEQHRQGMARVADLVSDSAKVLTTAIDAITRELGLRSPDITRVRGPFVVPSHRMDRWSVFDAMLVVQNIGGDLESTYDVRPLGDLATVSYGIAKSPSNRPGQHSRPYLRVANVQDGFLDLREIKHIDVPPDQMPLYQLKNGDILLCEGNSAELVGRPAIWRDELPDCVHQNHVLKVRCHQELLLPEYLFAFMQTPPSRGHFRRRAKNTTNLSTINSTDVNELQVAVPPIPKQREIGRLWEEARARVASLRQQAAELRRRVEEHAERAIVGYG